MVTNPNQEHHIKISAIVAQMLNLVYGSEEEFLNCDRTSYDNDQILSDMYKAVSRMLYPKDIIFYGDQTDAFIMYKEQMGL